MKTRKPFLLRIEPRLYEALEAWSEQEMRSVNGQIEYLLKQAVDKRLRTNREEGPGGDNQTPSPETTGEKPS